MASRNTESGDDMVITFGESLRQTARPQRAGLMAKEGAA